MERDQLISVIQKRLNLDGGEFQGIKDNPKYQRLFDNALKASRYRLVAEVVEAKGCHSGHVEGQKLFFDSAGNLLTRDSPERVCAFLLPNLTVLINAFFENLVNGRDPNEIMYGWTVPEDLKAVLAKQFCS